MARGDIRIFDALIPNILAGKCSLVSQLHAVPLAPDIIAAVDDQDPKLSNYVTAASRATLDSQGRLVLYGGPASPVTTTSLNLDLREAITVSPVYSSSTGETTLTVAAPVSWYWLVNDVVISQILIINSASPGEPGVAFIEMRTGENNDPWDLSTYRFRIFSQSPRQVAVAEVT